MDETRKYIKILNYIERVEISFPTPKTVDLNDPSTWNSIDNGKFNLTPTEFDSFINSLDKQGIIEIKHVLQMPEGSKYYTDDFVYDAGGKWIMTDDNLFDYASVNIKKLKELRNRLKDILRNEQIIVQEKKGIDEEIKLKTLGISIKGSYLIRGTNKIHINDTDKILLNFFYSKLVEKNNKCFDLSVLENTFQRNRRYIKNRISVINKKIKQLLPLDGNKSNILTLIKYEKGRGYRLNPKLL